MESKLQAENFTQIFFDNLPQILVKLPSKAFDYCVKDYEKPYIAEKEKLCIEQYTQKYLFSIDHTLINFSKKILE